MSALFRSIEGGEWGTVDIGSYAVYPDSWYFQQLHPESIHPSILDCTSQCRDIFNNQKWLPANTSNITHTTPMSYDDAMSASVMDTLTLIDANTHWFWGSVKTGGVGLAWAGSRACIIASYGMIYNAETDKYAWGVYTIPLLQTYNLTNINWTLKSCWFGYQYGFEQGTFELKAHYNLLKPEPARGNTFFFQYLIDSPRPYYIEWLPADVLHPTFRAENRGAYNNFGEVFNTASSGWGIGTYDDGSGVLIDFQTIYYPKYVYSAPRYGSYDVPIHELPPEGWISLNNANIWGGGEIPQQPNKKGGTSGGGGGGGGFDNTTDNNDFTDPTNWIDATDTGFITLYNPTKAQLKELADFLFTGITASAEITLKKLLANPMDYLVSLNMIHLPLTFTETEAVRFGGLSTGVVMGKLGSQFVKIYGGHYDIDEQFKSFLDYGKYSTIKISIPYCGIFPLPSDALMGGRLEIQYIVDLLTGSLSAELKITRIRDYVYNEEYTERIIATYSGNCFLPLPIASTDYRQAVSSLLGMTGGLATSIATGSPLPLIGSSANAVTNSKQDMTIGGNIGNNYGYMTQQKAFLILERPCQNLPLNYPQYYGYPSNIRFRHLSAVKENYGSGYIEIDNGKYWCGSVTNGFGSITNDESAELEQLVENGIWI